MIFKRPRLQPSRGAGAPRLTSSRARCGRFRDVIPARLPWIQARRIASRCRPRGPLFPRCAGERGEIRSPCDAISAVVPPLLVGEGPGKRPPGSAHHARQQRMRSSPSLPRQRGRGSGAGSGGSFGRGRCQPSTRDLSATRPERACPEARRSAEFFPHPQKTRIRWRDPRAHVRLGTETCLPHKTRMALCRAPSIFPFPMDTNRPRREGRGRFVKVPERRRISGRR